MIRFTLDSKEKSIQVEALLKGEKDWVKFHVGHYELTKKDDKLQFEITKLSTNREWMNIALENFMQSKQFELPAEYEKILDIVL